MRLLLFSSGHYLICDNFDCNDDISNVTGVVGLALRANLEKNTPHPKIETLFSFSKTDPTKADLVHSMTSV